MIDLSNEDADDDELVSGETVSLSVNGVIVSGAPMQVRVTSWRLLINGEDGSLLSSVYLSAIGHVSVKNKRDVLELSCSDARVVTLSCGSNRDAWNTLVAALTPRPEVTDFFAFRNPQTNGRAPELELYSEFSNLGGTAKLREASNQGFVLCSSYPERLVVPAASDEAVAAVAAFRSRGRMPVLSWLSAAPENSALLLRCSQPGRGVSGKTCREDEAMLLQFQELLFLDARPRAAAVGNATRGGGVESMQHYAGARLVFGDIGNIHAARKSYQQLVAAALAPHDKTWTAAAAGTKKRKSPWKECFQVLFLFEAGWNMCRECCTAVRSWRSIWLRAALPSCIAGTSNERERKKARKLTFVF